MKWTAMNGFIGISVAATLVILTLWFSATNRRLEGTVDTQINLALRRTAHQLLIATGDSTSRIPPVQHFSDQVWRVRFESGFDYNMTPAILQAALDLHGITASYDVAVRQCENLDIILGYNKIDFVKNNEVPCQSREGTPGCQLLEVTFTQPVAGKFSAAWLWVGLPVLLGAGLWLLRRKKPTAPAVQEAEPVLDEHTLRFGQSALDPVRFVLHCGGKSVQLTYRESKLLQLFAQHPNQLLTRAFILEQVWADEGILVGRSIDVFVSRLRKKLQADTTLSIVAVHGVGYQLEAHLPA